MSIDRGFQQIVCSSDEGRTMLHVWVEYGQVKPANDVTFKETGEKIWHVVSVYDLKISGVNRGWELNLPKSQRTEL